MPSKARGPKSTNFLVILLHPVVRTQYFQDKRSLRWSSSVFMFPLATASNTKKNGIKSLIDSSQIESVISFVQFFYSTLSNQSEDIYPNYPDQFNILSNIKLLATILNLWEFFYHPRYPLAMSTWTIKPLAWRGFIVVILIIQEWFTTLGS